MIQYCTDYTQYGMFQTRDSDQSADAAQAELGARKLTYALRYLLTHEPRYAYALRL